MICHMVFDLRRAIMGIDDNLADACVAQVVEHMYEQRGARDRNQRG